MVPFSKLSNHQADIEARAKAAAKADGDSYDAPVRPITIGDALLRLAEKAMVKQLNDDFARHLMPYQVGVAVKGGLGIVMGI